MRTIIIKCPPDERQAINNLLKDQSDNSNNGVQLLKLVGAPFQAVLHFGEGALVDELHARLVVLEGYHRIDDRVELVDALGVPVLGGEGQVLDQLLRGV